MRLTEKQSLKFYFKIRDDVSIDPENSAHIMKLLRKAISETEVSIEDKSSCPSIKIAGLCSLYSHYREIIFFSKTKDAMRGKFQNCILDVIKYAYNQESFPEGALEDAYCTLGLSCLPFIRGTSASEVYTHLVDNNLLADYFQGYKYAAKYFDNCKSTNPIIHSVSQEAYGVWKKYASDHHISDSILSLFLNSDIRFSELVSANEKNSLGIGEKFNEWQAK